MEGTSDKRAICNIGDTVRKHEHIISDLLAAHALTGCDTTACMWGVGKGAAMKTIEKGHTLPNVGDMRANIQSVIDEASYFVSACYGFVGSLSEARYKLWISKTGRRKVTRVPELKSLPPTCEAFGENVKRAHLQVCIWKHALDPEPPKLDPTLYGWEKDEASKSLIPVTTPHGTKPAPSEVLEFL